MSIPILNGSDTLLSANSGTVPNVSGALENWFQPMTFSKVTKATVNYKVEEVFSVIDFLGVVDPGTQPLLIRPDGQRVWQDFTCYTQIGVPLNPDDVILYQGVQYRVKAKRDYTLYGYISYELGQDYTGSGGP